MKYNLHENTWPQIEEYLKSKKSIIIPVGSTEQHGPTGLLGIDFMSAWEIAKAVGDRTNTLVSPPLCFGMAAHHMAFPGTVSLSPLTYVKVVSEIIESLAAHGFKKMIFINGHGGNIAPLTTAFCESKLKNEEIALQLHNWWVLPEVVAYESKAFGSENGFHATCGEISVTMFTHPDAHKDIPTMKFVPTPERTHWPMAAQEFRQLFPDGRMGSNPSLAHSHHGEALFKIAIDSICQKMG